MLGLKTRAVFEIDLNSNEKMVRDYWRFSSWVTVFLHRGSCVYISLKFQTMQLSLRCTFICILLQISE